MLIKEDSVQISASSTDSNVLADEVPLYEPLLKKVEEKSSENYAEYVQSEYFAGRVTNGLEQASELFYLSRLRPDIWKEFEDLLPDYQNYQRGTPREGVSAQEMVDEIVFGALSAQRETRKLEDWESIKGGGLRKRDIFDPEVDDPDTYEDPTNPFNFAGVFTKKGEIISRKEFEEKARIIAKAIANNLIMRGKKTAEIERDKERPHLIITMRKSAFREFLETGRYKARLDKERLSKSSMDRIQEVLKPGLSEAKLKELYRQVGEGYLRRKIRQIQLGTDPKEGEPNPVYGELIIDSDLEMPEVCNRGYGSYIHVVLKEDVLKRTVYYIGDSVSEASISSQTKHQVAYKEAVKARRLLNSFREMGPLINWTQLPEYVEANILGGVELEDVKEVLIRKDEKVSKVVSYIKANPEHFNLIEDDNYFRVTIRT